MTLELETYPFPIHQKHPRRPTSDEEQKAPETKIQGKQWLLKNNWGFEVSFVCFVIVSDLSGQKFLPALLQTGSENK